MGSESISAGFAFGAGLASFLSPCVLPLIPAYLGYLAGSSGMALQQNRSTKERWVLLLRSFGFVVGFSLVFVAMGSTASLVGSFFMQYRDIIRKAGALLAIVFGLYLTGMLPLKFLYQERRFSFLPKTRGFFPSILMGMAFGTGWTPCVGPILASILVYAGTAGSVGTGALLLAVYSLGLGVPFLLTALFLEYFVGFRRRFERYLPWVSRIGGGLLIVFGVLLYLDRFAALSF